MKITTSKYPERRIYKSRMGDLSVPRHRRGTPKVFPIATGGQVGVEVDRSVAAQGLRTWRNN